MGVSLGQLTQSNMPDNPEIWKAAAMADHFEKIQKLPDPVVGCPNFRRIPGYKVYCCGQPTAEGFKNCLEKVCGTIYPKDGKIIWLNMRQEPASTPPSSSTTRLGSPGQPLPVSSPACSKSSRSTPPLRDLLRQFLVSTLTSSRWTGTPWTPARTLSSVESSRSSKSLLLL